MATTNSVVDGVNKLKINSDGSINISSSSFDDRYVNITGDTMTGNLSFIGAYLDMNENQIDNINYLQFDLTPSDTSISEGKMVWNADDGTLNLGMPGGDVNLQLGQEIILKVKAFV